jgi:small subunit ribosomal protein S9
MAATTLHAIGRRKTSVARVYMEPGNGDIKVNNRDYKEYFPTGPLQYIVTQSQMVVNVPETYDIKATVDGGGIKGQAEAIRLAVARILVEVEPSIKNHLHYFIQYLNSTQCQEYPITIYSKPVPISVT